MRKILLLVVLAMFALTGPVAKSQDSQKTAQAEPKQDSRLCSQETQIKTSDGSVWFIDGSNRRRVFTNSWPDVYPSYGFSFSDIPGTIPDINTTPPKRKQNFFRRVLHKIKNIF